MFALGHHCAYHVKATPCAWLSSLFGDGQRGNVRAGELPHGSLLEGHQPFSGCQTGGGGGGAKATSKRVAEGEKALTGSEGYG